MSAQKTRPIRSATMAGCSVFLISAAGLAHAQTTTVYMSLKRDTLTTGTATGAPAGGMFTYATALQSGTTIGTLKSADATSNPNAMSLPDPANPSSTGSPSPGGLGKYTATYTVDGVSHQAKDDPFSIPTFGMSCYYTALQSDWGSPTDNSCKSVRIGGVTYSGTIKNPYSYPGTYCSSFIAEVKLQGSAQLNDGTYIQYDAGKIAAVASIKSADGSPVVANQTVARDRSIIPARNSVHVNADKIGSSLLANDTGGAIKGYRLDFFRGAGAGVCSGFGNPMAISACTPAQTACTGYAAP